MRRKILLLLALLAAGLSWSGVLDSFAEPVAERGFQRALVAFGVARTLNGVISVVQGTEVAVQPAGVGLTLTAGEILDPINDLVERFSWLMLASSALLGLQMLLSGILSGFLINAALTLALGLALLPLWRPATPARLGQLAGQAVIVLLTVRFLFPVIALAESAVYEAFLAERSAESLQYLEQTTERLGEAAELPGAKLTESAGAEDTWWDSVAELYRSAGRGFDMENRIAAYQAAVADASEHVVNLLVGFILETMLVPLLALVLALSLIRGALRRSGRLLFKDRAD